ncbi:uncharacterized protein LOC116027048 [Ipomoea triloba]|uniref:uncharacterized protein LOC116027048 n=1 Tax=Ipomoea triloba TaxID=35885 RepID=UPI00125E0C32|nr:uncharacterized protein LOC116027048 [Ipomoea triloba]
MSITPITDDRTGNEVRMDRSNRYKSNKRTPLNDITITPTTNDTIGTEVRIDRCNRYKSNKRTPFNIDSITPTPNDTIGAQVVIDRSNESTVTTLTHNVSTSIMECRNLNKDFNEACTEEDTTITESIGSLQPNSGAPPKFAQLYIHDTNNEITNRVNSISVNGTSSADVQLAVVNDIKEALDEHNVLVKSFRMARNALQNDRTREIKMRLIAKRTTDARTYNLPTVSEVAALIVGDLDPNMGVRDILVECKTGKLKRINELNPAYLPLQYPILYPYGEDGYRDDIQFNTTITQAGGSRQRITSREYFAYQIHERRSTLSTLLHAKRLFQQFLVDGYTMVESGRLLFIRNNQKALRCEVYKGLSDALFRGDIDPATQGKIIILPSSFTGGARYMIQNYQDAMAICRWIGYPNLFITFTCNPKWPEIQRYVGIRGLRAEDRPDIVARVFKMKLDALIKEFKVGKLFGPVKALIYTIEFQKRRLPHAHIVIFLGSTGIVSSPELIDSLISAEIPDKEKDPEYHQAVEDFMIHGPCGLARKNSPCMVNGKCSKHFPKKFVDLSSFDQDGYPLYRRCDDGKTVKRNGIELDNRYVVPHNRYLLLRYKAHMNVEWCNQSRSIKYLFKYVNKGNDRVTAEFYQSETNADGVEVVDEINMYYDCRYVSASEATWRLLSFEIQSRSPAVERLSFHLPDSHTVFFQDDEDVESVLTNPTLGQSMFTEWFETNKKYPEAKLLTYLEMPNRFVWKKNIRQWQPRQRGFAVGRIFYVPPGSGELYYLRCLLNIVKGPTSFNEIRTYNGVEYQTFKEACYARGLLEDDNEYIDAIEEASQWSTAYSLRKLFVTLLMSNTMVSPETIWNKVWLHLADDAQHSCRRLHNQSDLFLNDEQKKEFALIQLSKLLLVYNKTLRDFPNMPVINEASTVAVENCFLWEELAYDRAGLHEESERLQSQLTEEQRRIYDAVISDIYSNNGGLFFVYGYGGTGKTFLWRALSAFIRAKGHIVINVASSGIASLLLPGGRTAHSRFSIPISVNGDSTCNITQGSQLAELIVQAKLIIWDEAPMMHKHCFEALDKTMRDLLRFVNEDSDSKTFGGKTVVLGGDFRQILPVVPKGSRQDIVSAAINSSYLWTHCTTYLSSDTTCKADGSSSVLSDVHTPEFLSTIRASGLPNHSLTLKVGSPVMLMRNIDHTLGLCNGTRLVVTKLGNHVVEGSILAGPNAGTKVLIARMTITPSDPRLPFKFNRRQFPLMLSYAMTINKSQGQTLSKVGLILKKPVFVHGQLYVAASRVSQPDGLKILVCNESKQNCNSTTNVVYKEVFNNL